MRISKNKKIKITFLLLKRDFLKLKALAYFYNYSPNKMASLILEEGIEEKMQNLNPEDKKGFLNLLEITYKNDLKKKE